MKKLLATSLATLLLTAASGRAESMRSFTLQGFDDISLGTFTSTAITEDGVLQLGLSSSTLAELPGYNFVDGAIWKKNIYLVDSQQALLVVLNESGEVLGNISFDGTLISGINVIDNQLYVLTSTPAAVYKISAKNEAVLFADLQESYQYAWQLIGGSKGKLLLATGEPAAVVQLDGKGDRVELFNAPQGHFTALAQTPDGSITVGGSKTGLLYRGQAGKPFRALFQSDDQDIQALLAYKDDVFALTTSGGNLIFDEDASKEDITGAIYRIDKRGQVDRLAGATGELMLDIAVSPDNQLLISTASLAKEQKGQIYGINLANRKISLNYQAKSQRLIKLLSRDEKNWLVVEGGVSKIEVVSKVAASDGEYLSEIINTKGLSQAGRINLSGYVPHGQVLEVALRGGMTEYPENGWQEWTPFMPFPGGQMKLDPARYYQIKVRLSGQGAELPQLYQAEFTYLRDNGRPVVNGVYPLYNTELSLAGIKKSLPENSDTVKINNETIEDLISGGKNDKKEDEKSLASKAYVVAKKGVTTIVWQVDDPDGDNLVNDLYYREIGQRDWTKLLSGSNEQYYALPPSLLADGRYFFKVVTADRPDNTAARTLDNSGQSRVVVIDHRAPEISIPVRGGDRKNPTVNFKVRDTLSRLAKVAVSINGAVVGDLYPVDAMLDSQEEDFEVPCPAGKGNLKIIIEAEDIYGNASHVEAEIK